MGRSTRALRRRGSNDAPATVRDVLRHVADLGHAAGAVQVLVFGSRAIGDVDSADRHADLDVALVAAAGDPTSIDPAAVLASATGAALVARPSPSQGRACFPSVAWLRVDVHVVDAVARRRHRGPQRVVRRRRGGKAVVAAVPTERFVAAPWRAAGWLAIDALVRVHRGDRDEAELLLAEARRRLADGFGGPGRLVAGARELATVVDTATLRRFRNCRPRTLRASDLRAAARAAVDLAVRAAGADGDDGCARRLPDLLAAVEA